jgi:hypothetical protein
VDVDETASPASVGVAATEEDRTYWLLKAEPESRFENGVDVKFSIDDLAARTEPEPWDGKQRHLPRDISRHPGSNHGQESAPTPPATTSEP